MSIRSFSHTRFSLFIYLSFSSSSFFGQNVSKSLLKRSLSSRILEGSSFSLKITDIETHGKIRRRAYGSETFCGKVITASSHLFDLHLLLIIILLLLLLSIYSLFASLFVMHLPSDLTDLRKRDLKDEDHSLSLEFSSGKVMQRSYSYFDSQFLLSKHLFVHHLLCSLTLRVTSVVYRECTRRVREAFEEA